MHQAESEYYSYLLRLWRPHPAEPWRIALQPVEADESITFQGLAELLAFLAHQTGAAPVQPYPVQPYEEDSDPDVDVEP